MADKKEKDDEEIIPVEVDEKGRKVEDEVDDKDEKDDKKGKDDKDEDEEDESDEDDDGEKRRAADERVGHEDTDEKTERLRERRRAERAETKRVRREARDRNIRELDFLRRRNEQLERRFSEVETRTGQSELMVVDNRIAQIKGQIKEAEDVMAAAVKNAAGDDLVEATRIKAQLEDGLERLTTYRGQAEKQSKTRQADPQLLARVEVFRAEHPWWNPESTDSDSRMVAALDNQLILERTHDPRSAEYWDELTKRIKKKLPHRFKAQTRVDEDEDDDRDDDDKSVRRNGHDHDDDEEAEREERARPRRRESGGGPRFSSGGRGRSLKSNEVYVSPERKAALVEMGAWDDPVLRSRYLKQYQKYDRENKDQRH